MDKDTLWQQELQKYREKDIVAIDCDEADAEAKLLAHANGELPPSVGAFFHRWQQTSRDPWQALLQSAAMANPGVIKELASAAFLQPLRSLLAHVEQAAILCWPPTTWRKEQRWGYLFQLRAPRDSEESSHIVLHSPASPQDIAAAEAVIRLNLPPSYRQFLQITNGLGFCLSDTRALSWICSVGPAHVHWNTVLFNDWFECEKHQHELAASWRSFQNAYDYERIVDWERGEKIFDPDEAIMVPFAHTYEAWCFDRTRTDANGEYPVMFWDHETCEASEYYADFSAWFAEEVESYLWGE